MLREGYHHLYPEQDKKHAARRERGCRIARHEFQRRYKQRQRGVVLALRDQEGLSLDTSRSLYRLRRHRSGGTRNQGRGYRFRGKALGQR